MPAIDTIPITGYLKLTIYEATTRLLFFEKSRWSLEWHEPDKENKYEIIRMLAQGWTKPSQYMVFKVAIQDGFYY